jgi:heme oxygenase
MSLALKLREGTSQNHNEAEQAGFIRCFMKGVLEKETYTRQIVAFYYLYSAMEEGLEKNKDDKILSKIYFPELKRKEAIESDLEYFLGKKWKEKIHISKATQDYIDRIYKISFEKPYLLVAHSYVRYLGDLSGGQILKKIASKALGIEAHAGLDFYEFPLIISPNEFKKSYREALDSLPTNESQQDEILNESRLVFTMNKNIFLELEEDLIKNIGKEKYNSILNPS